MTEVKKPSAPLLEESDIEEKTHNAEIFIQAIDLVIKETSKSVPVTEMSDCLLAVGFDMLYHIVLHMFPDGDKDTHIEAVRSHIQEVTKHLEDNVWSQR